MYWLQYLKKGSMRDIQLDDMRDFQLTDKAMTQMGMTDEEKFSIYGAVAGVLHLGNVLFEEDPESKGGCRVTPQSQPSLETAAVLLGCDKDDLKQSLVCRAMQAIKSARAGTIIQ